MLAKKEAVEAGFDEAIMLNDAGTLPRSGMNLFLVSQACEDATGVIRDPRRITRNSVMSCSQ
jgi:branched-subunit amino acid aminotransferase/4-amino-4-deoxychorismate lyase